MTKIIHYAACALLLSCATHEAAASVADCDSALIISTYNKLESSKSDWRMAMHVDQSTYEKLKTDAGVSAIIYGIPVGANFGQFKENISSFVTDQSASYSDEQFRNVSWTGLSSDAADAYKECIRSQKKRLMLVPDKATDSDISFRVDYSVIGGSANPLPVSWFGIESGANTLPNAIRADSKRC